MSHCTTCTCASPTTETSDGWTLPNGAACTMTAFHRGRCNGARRSTCPIFRDEEPRQDPATTHTPEGRTVATAPAASKAAAYEKHHEALYPNPAPAITAGKPDVQRTPDPTPALMCWRDHVCSETPHLCNGYARPLAHRQPAPGEFQGSMVQQFPGV